MKKGKRINRSTSVNVISFIFLAILGLFMALPFIYVLNNSFKPIDELFIYPPKMFVRNPTLDNFADMFTVMSDSVVPFSRYIFNTFFVTAVGTAGALIFASLASFILAKYKFPLRKGLF